MRIVSLHKNYEKLIDGLKAKDRKVQHQVFELFAPKMLSVCRQYLKHQELAEEVMLNGFFKVFKYIDSFQAEGSFEGWIRRIMVNESISELRKKKALVFEEASVLDRNLEHATYVDSSLGVKEIQILLDELPEGYKTVFVLYAVEGYKHSEIAELLGISENTSKTQLFKARKALQQKLEQENNRSYGTQ